MAGHRDHRRLPRRHGKRTSSVTMSSVAAVTAARQAGWQEGNGGSGEPCAAARSSVLRVARYHRKAWHGARQRGWCTAAGWWQEQGSNKVVLFLPVTQMHQHQRCRSRCRRGTNGIEEQECPLAKQPIYSRTAREGRENKMERMQRQKAHVDLPAVGRDRTA
jgi:hypothetical protein